MRYKNQEKTHRRKAYVLALGGILLAVSVVCLYLSSFVPGVEMTPLALASLCVAIMLTETKPLWTLVFASTVAILALIIVPNKIAIIPYVFFFGPYPVIKLFAEKAKSILLRWTIKIAGFAVLFSVGYMALGTLLFGTIKLPEWSIWLIVGAGLVFFVIYDILLTLLMDFYKKRIKRERREIKLF